MLQGIAPVFGYLSRDVVAATGMGILSGLWLCTGALLVVTPPGATSGALGTLMLVGSAALALVASVGAASKLLPALVMGTAAVRFAVTGLYELSAAERWGDGAGAIGIVLSALALVAVAILALEDQLRRPLPPTLRRGRGREVVEAPLADQVRDVAREAGVREQL